MKLRHFLSSVVLLVLVTVMVIGSPGVSSTPVAAQSGDEASEDAQAEERLARALEAVVSTFEALQAERGDDEPIWGSMVKQTLKRRQPGFNESYYGFRSFNGMLEQAQTRGLIALEKDGKSGGYLVRSIG